MKSHFDMTALIFTKYASIPSHCYSVLSWRKIIYGCQNKWQCALWCITLFLHLLTWKIHSFMICKCRIACIIAGIWKLNVTRMVMCLHFLCVFIILHTCAHTKWRHIHTHTCIYLFAQHLLDNYIHLYIFSFFKDHVKLWAAGSGLHLEGMHSNSTELSYL